MRATRITSDSALLRLYAARDPGRKAEESPRLFEGAEMSFSPIIQLPVLSHSPPRLHLSESSHALELGSQTPPSAQSCFPNLGLLLSERVVKDLCSDVCTGRSRVCCLHVTRFLPVGIATPLRDGCFMRLPSTLWTRMIECVFPHLQNPSHAACQAPSRRQCPWF